MILAFLPGGPELIVLGLVLLFYLVAIAAFLGGLGYFLLRVRSGGSVDERLDRIERKIGRLEAQVEHLREDVD
ncbi:MAG: hypothetical protein ABEJ76_06100 [Halanaeroarchaeum sp.]